MNKYWTECAERLKLDIREEVVREQEWLNGRSFANCNIIDVWFYMEIVNAQDVLLDRCTLPCDIDSGRRITTSA